MPHFFYNPHVAATFDAPAPDREPLELHRRMPGYATTPLVDVPELAAALRVAQVWVKDESRRLGMPAFKILGAAWAIYRVLLERLGEPPRTWETLDDLAGLFAPLQPLALLAATEGNHGRAVARVAALLGCQARIYVPAGTAEARIGAIAGEGASVTVVDGTYDDAVAHAAAQAGERAIVISDTSWPGYEDIPRWVSEGYSTIFREIDDELARRGVGGPDLIAVQIGVGALAAAVVRHYRRAGAAAHPRIVGVEPAYAACALASIQAGRIVAVPLRHDRMMAGLNCGMPSLIAWPALASGIDLFVAIGDERARQGMRALAAAGVAAGAAGAAGAGGLLELLAEDNAEATRAMLGVNESTRVLVLATEGMTEPEDERCFCSQSY